MSDRPRLLLFDIDGTLLRCGKQVRPLFCGALEGVYGGHRPLAGYGFAGKTDPQIVLELAGDGSLDHETIHARLGAMEADYLARLEAGLDARRMELLPGVRALLDRLDARNDIAVGLLTGNWRSCARVKLDRFALWSRFPFGAFGSDAAHRPDLVPVARERARAATGRRFDARDILIIGDSALDVACAHAHGVRALAVATGFADEEALRACGADWVAPDLVAAAREHPWLADDA